MRKPAGGRLTLVWVLVPLLVSGLAASQYTAFSLKVAQERIEKAGENWRETEPEVLNLGGINKVEGFVYDTTAHDLILVGDHESDRATLTLDDLVVALRARFRYGEWPLVSIDPTPETKTTQMQHVRFEGGIENTAFGQALYDADYRLKQISMGLAAPGIAGMKTGWDRDVEQTERGTAVGSREVTSRFWFYPINPHVVVREDVCVVRGLKVGVFTEVLSAKIDGNVVEDVKAYKSTTDDAFAADVSQRFDDLCATQPSYNRLRGLQELVAVSKALEELERKPDLGWWLDRYSLARPATPKDTKVLQRKYEGNRGSFVVSGGVHLEAVAIRLNAGDVTALRHAVMTTRPSAGNLSWRFVAGSWVIPISSGMIAAQDAAPLLAQALFLGDQGRDNDAILLYSKILEAVPDWDWALNNRGLLYSHVHNFRQAFMDLNRALATTKMPAIVYSNRGTVFEDMGQHENAKANYKRAAETDPSFLVAKLNLARAYARTDDFDSAIACCSRMIETDPCPTEAYVIRAFAYMSSGRLGHAMSDCNAALRIDSTDATALAKRGLVYESLGHLDSALADFDAAVALDPNLAEGYTNRGVLRQDAGLYELAIRDFDAALAIDTTLSVALNNRGAAKRALGLLDAALADLCKAIDSDSTNAGMYRNRGKVYLALGLYHEALSDFNAAVRLDSGSPESHYSLGLACQALGDHAKALRDFDLSIELDTLAADVYSSRAWSRLETGDRAGCIDDCNTALRLDVRQEAAYNTRASAYLYLGRPDLAVGDCIAAVRLDSAYSKAYNNLGTAYTQLGRYQSAIENYDKAIDLNPGFYGAYLNKGVACEECGRIDDAVRAYQKFIELAPPLDEAERVSEAERRIRRLRGW